MSVAGCDPHRETFTVAVADAAGVEIATGSFPANPTGFDDAVGIFDATTSAASVSRGPARTGVTSLPR